jgi:uncharacterized UPF0160 family protein
MAELPAPYHTGLRHFVSDRRLMIPDQIRPLLVTHSGKFHCDDVFAYAVLRLALDLDEPGHDHTLLRSRKPKTIEAGDIVWDVGSLFDAALNRFDHHQRGAPLRPDDTPFSSAGLVWQSYGERAVAALLRSSGSEQFAAPISAEIDDSVIRRIDEIDNGVSPRGPVTDETLSFARLIGDFNPSWDAAEASDTLADVAFLEAAALASSMLRRRVDALRARLAAETIVLAAHASGDDPRILVLDRGMPWKNTVITHSLPVLFAVSSASDGNWTIDTMPAEPGSFAPRLQLPEAWAGLQAAELAEQTGVADAVFVHLRRFVGAARSREGAVTMARRALEMGRNDLTSHQSEITISREGAFSR